MNGAVLPNCEAIFAKVTGAILREMGVSPLDRVFIDGSKFEANANKYKFRFKSRKRMLSLLDRARTLFLSAGIPFPESPGRPFSLPMGRAAGEAADRLRAEGTDPAGIVTGRGRRLTPGERLLVEAERLLQRMLAYEETEAICGPSRDSYYRTDTDATAMCLKEDYYSGLGSNMHAAYNVQYAVSSGIIVGYYVSQDRSDSRTFPAFVDRLRDMWGAYPSAICADAGYGSLANYQYLRARGIGNFVKYPGWEGEVSGTRPAFIALSPDGALRCIDGKEAAPGSSAEASPILRLRVRGGGALREMPVHEVLPDAPQGKVRPRQGVRDSPPPPRLQGGGEEEPPVAGGDRDEGQPEHPGRGDVRDDQAGPRVRQVQEEGARRSRDGDDADLPRRQRAEILQVPEDGEAPRILEGAGRARGRVSPQADLRRETRREKPAQPEEAA
jgi:hypothetical protein